MKNHLRSYLLRFLLFVCFFAETKGLAEAINDPDHVLDPYTLLFRKHLFVKFGRITLQNLDQLKTYAFQSGLSDNEKYISLRTIIMRLDDLTDDVLETQRFCQLTSIRPDDFLLTGICYQTSPGITVLQKSAKWTELIEKSSVTFPNTVATARLAQSAVYYLLAAGDIPRTIDILKTVLDGLPKDAVATILALKAEIARIYTLPSMSEKLTERGLALYDELETAWRKDENRIVSADVAAWRKASVKALQLHRYEDALIDFARVKTTYQAETKTYVAYILALLGRKNEAMKALDQLSSNRDFEYAMKTPVYECYIEITRQILKIPYDLKSCINLNNETSYEDLLAITKELLNRNLDLPFRQALLEQFWRTYVSKIEPGNRLNAEHSVNLMELKEAKFDAALQKNLAVLEQKKNSFKNYILGSSIAFLLFVLGATFRIYQKNSNIQKLHTYIETQVLQRFLPPVLVREILTGQSRLDSEAHECLITVLFSDLVEFTALTERIGAQKSAKILNEYMSAMIDVIYSESGTIDKFIGDAVMVLFGAPSNLDEKEQALRAVRCGQKMLKTLHHLNESWQRDFGVTIAMRIGVHQGQAIVGTFGSEKRSDYTAIGSTVNAASRIEGKAEQNQILMSQSVAQYFPREVLRNRGHFKLKGFVHSFELMAFESEILSVSEFDSDDLEKNVS